MGACNAYTETGKRMARGVTAPFAMRLPSVPTLDGWHVVFTLRTTVGRKGSPVAQVDETDDRMSVNGNVVTVTLGPEDTWQIPEMCTTVFVQLNISLGDVHNCTKVYGVAVGPNIMEDSDG